MKNKTFAFIAAAFMASAFPACATTINYTLTSGTDTITFSVSQNPTPLACALSSDCFSVAPVAVTIDGITDADATVSFYTPANGGGLTILEGTTTEINNDGPGKEQLYSGSSSNPTLETFSDLQLVAVPYYSPVLNEAFLLNATASGSTTPEPKTYVLLLTGLGLIGSAPLRRRNVFNVISPS